MPDLAVDLLVGSTLLITIFTAVCWLISGQVVRRVKQDPDEVSENEWPNSQYVSFTTKDGIELNGYLTGLDRPGRPVVVICSGANGTLERDSWLIRPLLESGCAVLQFDWRGHGISSGRRTTLGAKELNDLQAALDFLQSCGVRKIGLLGFSMGAAVALRTVAIDKRVSCIVADSPIIRIEDALTGILRERTKLMPIMLRPAAWLITRFVELRANVRYSSVDVLEIAPKVNVPVALIFGTEDQLISQSQRQKLVEACSKSSVWLVENAGHRSAYQLEPDQYQQRIVDFFKSVLFIRQGRT